MSWILRSSLRGQKQTAWRVLVASSPAKLDKDIGDLWDSGKVKSDRSIQIGYAGSPGFKHFTVGPGVVAEVDWVKCPHESPCGTIRSDWRKQGDHWWKTTSVPMTFEPYQSLFVVFPREGEGTKGTEGNFPGTTPVATLEGPWDVSFDPKRGGPEKVTFETLQDWTTREERGIKFYSGIATYRKRFEFAQESERRVYLDLGTVHDIARVRLNGRDLGVVWCVPWRVDVSEAIKPGENQLEIEIANRWSNRMLGDQDAPDKNVRTLPPRESEPHRRCPENAPP